MFLKISRNSQASGQNPQFYFIIKGTQTLVFSCYFSEVFKSTFFTEHLRVNAFEYMILTGISIINFQVKSSVLSVFANPSSKKYFGTLNLSWRRPMSYRNQSNDSWSKSMDWFLYDNGLRHERLKRNKLWATVLKWLKWCTDYGDGLFLTGFNNSLRITNIHLFI